MTAPTVPAADAEAAPDTALPFRDLFEVHPQPMWVQDAETLRILAVNDAALTCYGHEREAFLTLRAADIRAPAEATAAPDGGETGRGVARAAPSLERHRRTDGRIMLAEVTICPIQVAGRSAELVVAQDVTARWRAEAMAATETAILQLVSAGAPLAEVLERTATAVESLTRDARVSILLLDPDGVHIRHGVAPSLPDSFNRLLDGVPIGPGAGSCGSAMFRRERIIVTDTETDPLWRDFRDVARAHEIRACWSTPVLDSRGAVVASFALYSRAPRAPHPDDIALLDRMAGLVGLAIERTRTVTALRDSEERFRQFAENIEEVFWMSGATGTPILYVSPAYATIWGRSPQALQDDPAAWLEAVHEEDRPRVAAGIAAHRTSARGQEYRIVRPDGEIRWIIDRAFPVRDRNGAVYRIVGTARDITERRRAELALQESEQRFQAIASATADLVWDWDIRTDTVWWGGALPDIFGYRPEALATAGDWAAHIHPEDRDRVTREIQATISRGDRFWEGEYRFLHADGRVFEVEDHGCLILGPDGRPTRFVGGMTDVTERKRAQRDLRERIKELRCLYRVLELTSDQARSVEAICADIAAAIPAALMHEVAAVARIRIDESEHRSPEWVEPVARLRVPIRTAGAEIGFVEAGYRTVQEAQPGTQTPFLDQEREMVEAVATHVGRMIQGRRIADRLTQSERLGAVGELTGGIAHDFNNLLTVILGNAELMSDGLADRPALARLAEMTKGAALRGAELTHHLLAFARKQALLPEITAIDALITGMIPLLERTLGGNIQIGTKIADGLWQALVDPAQLESAVLNLCINARDAMPLGGRLSIELANVDLDETCPGWTDDLSPGSYIMLAVTDTGTGMSATTLRRAFEPFFTTKPTGKGSGLGLSMVYGFTKQSRGHIRIYSELGHGTTVKLYLPRAGELAETASAVARSGEAPGGIERILLVEDDDLVREHVELQLQDLGYSVTSVGNGAEALAALDAEGEFDLLFTDVVMPGGMDGRQLAERVRSLKPHLPVLFTSGYTEDAVLLDRRLDPGLHLLNKPYRRAELAAKLREVLAGG